MKSQHVCDTSGENYTANLYLFLAMYPIYHKENSGIFESYRVPTAQGKQAKWPKYKFPVRENTGNLEMLPKHRENTGNSL